MCYFRISFQVCLHEEREENRENGERERAAAWGAAEVRMWTDGQGVLRLNIITILIIHVNSVRRGPAAQWEDDFSTPQRDGHQGLNSLLQFFPDTVINTILPSLCIALQQWSTVHFEQSPSPASLYQAIFVPWGLVMHPSSIISKYYVYACLFSLFRMIDC